MAVALAAACMAVVAGCDGKNPAEVSRQRQPQLYRNAPRPAAPAVKPAPLKGAETSSDTETAGGLEKLDVAGERSAGRLRIRVNDPVFPSRLDPLFDGDTNTLSRSENVNPLLLVFSFDRPIPLRAVRIYPSYSSYDWSLDPKPGHRLLVRDATADAWSGVRLEAGVETDEVRLEIQRMLRDDHVHINEVELWVEAQR